MNWVLKKFDALTPSELYAIIQLRNEVFVVEQHCVYQDADNKDRWAYHYMGWKDNKLVAYTRLLPPGLSYNEPSIGSSYFTCCKKKWFWQRTNEKLHRYYI
ncbi:MAG TPA: hypothetical protein PKI55_12255 [Chitinophagaceae bacterium]|nr:hypothetical protein [Chitinophagaceae bacterium]